MTGGGTSNVATVAETDLMTEPAEPTFFQPGRNITIEDAELSNTLERMTLPDQAESVESIAGRLEGAFSANWAMAGDTVSDALGLIFNSAGPLTFTGGRATTSSWYLGVDYLDGTCERNLQGVLPTEYTLEWDDESNTVTQSLTALYADEEQATSITPTSITESANGNTVPFHGASLDINTVPQTKLSSITLSISDIARYQWGASRYPLDAVINYPKTTLDVEAVFSETDQLALAYGADGATTPQDSVNEVSATLDLSANGGSVASWSLSAGKPDTYNWSNLVSADDTTEPLSLQISGTEVTV